MISILTNLCLDNLLKSDSVLWCRKGKTIPSYELEAKVGWSGEIKDGDGTVVGTSEGTIHFPYIADENHDEDAELRVSTSTEGSVQQRLKDALLSKGKKVGRLLTLHSST